VSVIDFSFFTHLFVLTRMKGTSGSRTARVSKPGRFAAACGCWLIIGLSWFCGTHTPPSFDFESGRGFEKGRGQFSWCWYFRGGPACFFGRLRPLMLPLKVFCRGLCVYLIAGREGLEDLLQPIYQNSRLGAEECPMPRKITRNDTWPRLQLGRGRRPKHLPCRTQNPKLDGALDRPSFKTRTVPGVFVRVDLSSPSNHQSAAAAAACVTHARPGKRSHSAPPPQARRCMPQLPAPNLKPTGKLAQPISQFTRRSRPVFVSCWDRNMSTAYCRHHQQQRRRK